MEKFDTLSILIEKLDIDNETKTQLQRQLQSCRGEFLYENSKAKECAARQDVYAEICENMLKTIVDRVNVN